MAKKHAKNAGLLIPDVLPDAPTPAASRYLPASIRPLFLSKLIRTIANNTYINRERREEAHKVFIHWADNLAAGKLHKLNEGEVEADFTQNLLKVLGYQSSMSVLHESGFSLNAKWPVPGMGIADVALGRFHSDESSTTQGQPIVMVELKGAGTDLDKVKGSRSPVSQAWDYLNHTDGASWALVSNFEEIRLYHRRKGSNYLHRVFLADLRDKDAFADFYAVFHAESLLGTGNFREKAEWLLTETELKQETVGDRLYVEYRSRRSELLHLLMQTGLEREPAIAAAQKLLDRVLFLAFAEDRGLLHSSRTLEETANIKAPMLSQWKIFQYLFRAIDKGDLKRQIPQYNGELFKPDPILDDLNFELDDIWATVFKGFGDFDYKDEVTVDVLGRIFEQSITDIEKLKAGTDLAEPEPDSKEKDRKKPGQRKLQGVFYTDASIVDYLINAALQPAFDAEKSRLAAHHGFAPANGETPPADLTKALLSWLDTRTVCDPACGSGAFLNAAYNWFEDHRVALLKDLHDSAPDDALCQGEIEDWRARSAHKILQNNLFGVDLSYESVEIARLSLWIRTARKGQLLAPLSDNVVQGNSVVDDPAVDKLAFDWKTRFKRVFDNGGFDAVVGNPPYVRQERLSAIKPHLEQHFASYHGMADLYVYFYERGLSLLRPGGRLAFVVTNKWMKAGYGEPLRTHFGANSWVESVVDFGHAKFFDDAEVFPCFLVARKPDDTPAPETVRVCVIPPSKFRRDRLRELVQAEELPVERSRFSTESWQLEPGSVVDLFDRIGKGNSKSQRVTLG